MGKKDHTTRLAEAAAEVEVRLGKARVRIERSEARADARKWAQCVVAAEEAATQWVATEIGDFPGTRHCPLGTTAQANGQWRVPVMESQVKGNLANFAPKLRGNYRIISVPSIALDGTKLDNTERAAALHAALNQGGERWVPIVTMSGLKSGSVYAIPESLAKEWWKAMGLNLAKDGRKFAVYAGLVFSEIAAPPVAFRNITVTAAPDGKDGGCNSAILPTMADWWHGHRGGQFRAVELYDGFPVTMAKGVISKFKHGPAQPALNDTQVKLGKSAKVGATADFIIAPTDVDSRLSRSWISAEPIVSLQDRPAVRQFLAAKVKAVVAEMLSLVTPQRRAELLDRLGGVRLNEMGDIEAERRAILDLLASNIPWCEEIETRITRFLLREITQHVVPSGGIEGKRSIIVTSDAFGAKVVPLSEAKAIAFRLPHNGPENTVGLDRDPYVKGVGMVLTAEAVALTDGDGDGDLVIVITDPEVVSLFARFTNWELKGEYKPAKSRIEAELSADALEDFVTQQWAEAWWVGGLTVASWKLAQAGDMRQAARLGTLAKLAPMAMKHHMVIEGAKFADVVSREYGAVSEELKKIKLNWHDATNKASEWKSPRQLAGAEVEVQSHLDACWNAAVEAGKEWAKSNPMKPLSMTTVRRLTFEHSGRPSSADMMEARRFYMRWGQYWAQWFQATKGKGRPGYKHPIYTEAREWARNATVGALAAMLQIMPKDPSKDGFGVKFHTVFAAGRGNEVLGYHPDVIKMARQKRGAMWNWLREQRAWCVVAQAFDEAITNA